MDLIMMLIVLLLPVGIAVYYGYLYYTYKYKSEERLLRITRFHKRQTKHGYVYYVIGELTDMPGMELRSFENYTSGGLKFVEGEVIPVRYTKGNRFAIDPDHILYYLRIMVVFIVIAAVAMFITFRN